MSVQSPPQVDIPDDLKDPDELPKDIAGALDALRHIVDVNAQVTEILYERNSLIIDRFLSLERSVLDWQKRCGEK